MPALNARPSGTAVTVDALTGTSRRRIWKHPALTSHSLLVLTPDRLYLTPLAGDPKPETVAAAEAGADLDDLLGPLATVVELATVRHVKLDLLTNSLVVEYRPTGGGTERLAASRLTVVFATPDEADVCFSKLWRRLGDGVPLLPYQRDWWALARTPLVLLAAVLLTTAALALALAALEDVAAARAAALSVPGAPGVEPQAVRKSPLAALLTRLSWQGVCLTGGAVAAVLQVWLYRRLTQPPVSLELVRGQG
jgi:hypothetical protein